MAKITNTTSISFPIQSQRDRALDKAAAKMGYTADARQKSLKSAVVDMQNQRLELLLSVQNESKTTFTFQAGIQERAAAQWRDRTPRPMGLPVAPFIRLSYIPG